MSNFNYPNSGANPLLGYLFPDSAPGATSDFGLLHDFYQIGGYQTLATIQDRNDIPIKSPVSGSPYDQSFIDPTGFASGRRKIGMIVYVQETNETYRLIPNGYFGNGGTGATGNSQDWLSLNPWDKAVLLNPTASGICNENISSYDPSTYSFNYESVTGSGNPDDCWIRVSTETETTYVSAYEIAENEYGGTGSKGFLEYVKDTNYLLQFPSTNTGPVTLEMNGFSAKSLKKQTPFGLQDLSAGDIKTDIVYPVFYDGTYFQTFIPTSSLSIFGPSGDVLTTGATGIYFQGSGISASAQNGFVTVSIDAGGGIKEVYSQNIQIVGGDTGIPLATSFNFIDGTSDQPNYIAATSDQNGNVTVSVKTPGIQSSTINVGPDVTYVEASSTKYLSIFRTLSGEADKFPPTAVEVSYDFVNGTAINGEDYIGASGSLLYSSIETTKTISFQLKNNFDIDPDRDFSIVFTINTETSTGNVSFLDDKDTIGVTIQDDDTPSPSSFRFLNSGNTQYEPKTGSDGTTGPSYEIPVRLSTGGGSVGPTGGAVTLQLLNTGTAVRGDDFVIVRNGSIDTVNSSWNVSFENGETNPLSPIYLATVRNPTKYDTNTYVNFGLTGATAYGQIGVGFPASLGTPSNYTFNILEADIRTVSTFRFSSDNYGTVPEQAADPNGILTLYRDVTSINPSLFPLGNSNRNYLENANSTISLNFLNTSTAIKGTNIGNSWSVLNQLSGSAVQTLNYSATNSNTVNFLTGETTKYVKIPVLNDGVAESGPFEVDVNISNPLAFVGGQNEGFLGGITASNFQIFDSSNWANSTFYISGNTNVNQGDSNYTITFTIYRNITSGIRGPLTLEYSLKDITAEYDVHYTMADGYKRTGTLNFDVNDISQQVDVVILGDSINYTTETQTYDFVINIFNLVEVNNYSNGGAVNIIAKPGSLTVSILDYTIAPTLNRTFYYFHGGGSTVPFVGDITAAGATYILPDGSGGSTTTSSLDTVMSSIIGNFGETYFPVGGSFYMTLGLSITSNNGQTTWTYPATTSQEFYYLAVPDNADFTEVLVNNASQTKYLANLSNNISTYALSSKNFTYDGEAYILYRIPGNSTSAASWKFV